MLLGGGVDGLAGPLRDEERVHVQVGIAEGHRHAPGVVHVDAEFFEAFADDSLNGLLVRFDVPADEIPTVGIPPPGRMAMRQQHLAAAHDEGDSDGGARDRSATLGRAS